MIKFNIIPMYVKNENCLEIYMIETPKIYEHISIFITTLFLTPRGRHNITFAPNNLLKQIWNVLVDIHVSLWSCPSFTILKKNLGLLCLWIIICATKTNNTSSHNAKRVISPIRPKMCFHPTKGTMKFTMLLYNLIWNHFVKM
jgi:hypothetical protein